MIVVTGAAGFIGSWMIKKLNDENFNFIIAVDKFGDPEKEKNLEGLKIQERVDRDNFFNWLNDHHELVEFIFHLGARTNTLEQDKAVLAKLNTEYSKQLWEHCVNYQIPLLYASSAATYGNGEKGFSDDEEELDSLIPLNEYGRSKHEFDLWAIKQTKKPFFWCGLKFFNVFGPNEAHKGKMASMVYQMNEQVQRNGAVTLFKSYQKEYDHGDQRRDFIHVKEVVNVCYWFMHHRKNAGIYNLGTGKAITFNSIADKLFSLHNSEKEIQYVDMPLEIKDKYQYSTIAPIQKLLSIGYKPDSTDSLSELASTY